ncbi:MAG: hypothetical protein HQL88_06075 [Magnetococcales bacterium]|nr:hypothetical protein [Magnetococcales bacterium]
MNITNRFDRPASLLSSDTGHPLNAALQIVGDGPEHPEFDSAWAALALSDHAEIRRAMRLAMEETFGPYPPPTGYSDEGEPYWETAVMSRYLGIPVEQLDATALELREQWGPLVGVMESEQLHRVH